MAVERTVDLVIASAEMNDECGVDVTFFDTTQALTVDEARSFATSLLDASDDAIGAAIAYASRPTEPARFDIDGGGA